MTQHLPPQKARPMSGAVFNKLPNLQGGRFELGFISAFTSSLALSYTTGKSNDPLAIMGIGAAIGGTAESLGGGKFANGAVTGAFVALFNHGMHLEEEESRFREFQNKNDAYDDILKLQADNKLEYAGYHFKDKYGDDLFVIDLLSSTSSNTCEWHGSVVHSYYDAGYTLEGIFHTHPNSGHPWGTSPVLLSMKDFHASYQEIIRPGRVVHRYNSNKTHSIWDTRTIGSQTLHIFIPDKTYKY